MRPLAKNEIARMCHYISALLYYYGVMKLDEMHCCIDCGKHYNVLQRMS